MYAYAIFLLSGCVSGNSKLAFDKRDSSIYTIDGSSINRLNINARIRGLNFIYTAIANDKCFHADRFFLFKNNHCFSVTTNEGLTTINRIAFDSTSYFIINQSIFALPPEGLEVIIDSTGISTEVYPKSRR